MVNFKSRNFNIIKFIQNVTQLNYGYVMVRVNRCPMMQHKIHQMNLKLQKADKPVILNIYCVLS